MAERRLAFGTIYFDEVKGCYVGDLRWTDEFGVKGRVVRKAKTKAAVKVALREVADRIEAGTPAQDSRVTLAAWIERWVATGLEAADLRRKTKDNYAWIVRKHVLGQPIARLPIGRVRPSHVEELYLAKGPKGEGLSGSTLLVLHAALGHAMRLAKREGLVRVSPMAEVARPQAKRRQVDALSEEVARELLAALAADPMLELMVRFLMATGLRRGEALGLHWSDVDLEAGQLRTEWQGVRDSEGLRLTELKSSSSHRSLPLPAAAATALRARAEQQMDEMLRAGERWEDTGLVFTNRWGRLLEPRNVNRRFDAVCARAGIDTHLHALRHTAATLLVERGVHMRVVQEWLGHSDSRVTEVYAHVTSAAARAAATAMDEAMQGW